MKRLFLLLACIALTTSTAHSQSQELQKLNGAWLVTAFEAGGKTQVSADAKNVYIFSGDKLVLKETGQSDKVGTVKINVSKTPRQMDWTSANASDKEVMQVIYEIKGESMRIAYSINGPKGKRLTRFDAKDAVIIHLKREKFDPVIAEARFNNASDKGWAAPWGPKSAGASVQKKVSFEGGAALHLSNTGYTRRFAEAQKGKFVVEQYVQVPKGGGAITYVRQSDIDRDGPVWRVADGTFSVLQNGKWLDTSYVVDEGKWQKVVITIDGTARSWEFAVDGREYKSVKPLPFRAAVDRLDSVRYQVENEPGVYLGAVRVLRASEGAAAAADPYSGWQTVEGNHHGLRFTLRLPPGWPWKDATGKELAAHDAVKELGAAKSVFFMIYSRKLDAQDKKVTPAKAARLALKEHLSQYPESKVAKHLAKSVIKIGDLDAAWFAEQLQPPGQPLVTELNAYCELQTAGYEVHMSAYHGNLSGNRTAKEFEESRATFELIVRSYRVVGKAEK